MTVNNTATAAEPLTGAPAAPAPRRRRTVVPLAAAVPAPTTAPPQPPAQRPWERKRDASVTLIATAELGRNDEMRLAFLRMMEQRDQRREYNRILRDGFPYILLGSTGGFLRGTTLSLLPLDLVAALSLSAACPHYSGKTQFNMLIGEQGDKQVVEMVADTLAVLKHKTPGLFTVNLKTPIGQGAADANS